MKKYDTLIFDLDGTLAVSKSALTHEMGQLLADATNKVNIVIITGGKFDQIKKQVIDCLGVNAQMKNFYVLPTSGSSMVEYNTETQSWDYVYKHELTKNQKEILIQRLNEVLKKVSFSISLQELNGEQIEDRGSQLTFSALGQSQKPKIKELWDPLQLKRKEIVSYMEDLQNEFDINIGGTTSIDITLKGIDKEYGIKEFYKKTPFNIENGLFVGDKIFPGGNDYPATKTGIDYSKTSGPEETMEIIKRHLGTSN